MPLFSETVSILSALPPDALLNRIRGLAAGTLPMPPQSWWRSPVRWSLREQDPHEIRLMPLFPPLYRAQQPSFIGMIERVGAGSVVRGRIQSYGLTLWITAFLVFAAVTMSSAGVLHQLSRHGSAMPIAMTGLGLAAAAMSMLRFSVWFAGVPIRQLLETASSSDSGVTRTSTIRPASAIPPETRNRWSARNVLKAAAAIDGFIALVLISTPLVNSRLGRPVTVLIAAILVSGAGFLWVIANRGPERGK